MSSRQPARRMRRVASAAAAAAAVLPLWAGAATVTDTYTGPGTGSYNVPGNWSLGVVPNNGTNGNIYNVVVDGNAAQNSTVRIQSDLSPTINNLTVDAGDALQVGGNIGLTINGTSVVNNGTIVLNYNQYYAAGLGFNVSATLSGTGSVLLDSAGGNATLSTATGATLTQAAGHTIDGLGLVAATLANAGTVNANSNGNVLYLRGTTTNTATLEASAGGTLQLDGGSVSDGGGTISAKGGTVNVYGITVTGGTLNQTAAAGSAINVQNATLAGAVTIAGGTTVNVNGNSDLSVTGTTLTNSGTLLVNNNQYYAAQLIFNANTAVGGTGTITLDSGGTNAQLSTGSGNTVTLGSGQTVDGYGQINATAVNQGTVNADVAGQTLTISSAAANNVSGYSLANTGTLKATTGTLQVNNGATVNNAGGTILAAGGTVQLFNATVNGGTLTSTGAGAVAVQNATLTGGPTLSAGTTVDLNGNSSLSVTGPGLTNNGTVVVNNNQYYASVLSFGSTTTVGGTGTINLDSNGTNAQLSTATGATLTLGSGQTVVGYGQVNATLVNNGTVNANVSGQPLAVTGGGITNNNVLEATGGGTLSVGSVSVTQGTAGVIQAVGNSGGTGPTPSAISIGSSTISGGTLTAAAGDTITIDNSTLTGSPTISTGTLVNVDGNTSLTVTGTTLTDNGHVVLNDNQYYASTLQVNSNLTLAGTGRLTLDGSGNNAQVASGTTAANVPYTLSQSAGHTTDGYGQVNALFVNNGTVDADVTSQALTIAGDGTTNNAALESTNGGTLSISNVTITQGTAGVIQAVGNSGGTGPVPSAISINGATISGGTLSAAAGDTATADNSTFAGGLTISTGTLVNVDGNTGLTLTGAALTDNGHIVLNDNQYYGSTLQVNSNLTLAGTGTLTLDSAGNNAQLDTGNGFTLTQGSGHTINGYGQVNATLVNNGTVNANANGQALAVAGTTTNNGLFLANNGATLSVASGVLTNLNGTTLTGGSYEADANSTLLVPGTVTTNAAAVTLSGTGSTFAAINPVATNSGSFNLLLGRSFTTAGSLANSGNITVGYAGTLPVTAPAALTVAGSFTQTAGLTTADGTLTVTGSTAVTGGQLLFNPTQGATPLIRPLGPLSIGGTGTVTLAVTPTTATRTLLAVTGLTFAGTTAAPVGRLDLGNGDLDVPNGNLAVLTAAAAAGFNAGLWNGTGIASTAAAGDARHLRAVGVILDQTPTGSALYATFDGQPVAASDVLARYTYYGDANLDGVVNAADYTRIDAGFVMHLTGWQNGDFNYDGVVDGSDYTLMDNAFNQQSGGIAAPAVVAAPAFGVAAVPEPASLGLLTLATLAVLGRHRRGRQRVSSRACAGGQ